MSQYTLTSRQIPLDESFDVIVVGGGPSGCTAATAAAREGARTLLIEATSSLGGMGTSGLVPAWCPFSDKQKVIYGGLAQKVFELSKATTPHVPAEQLDWVPINPEALKRLYDELVTSAGAQVLFNTTLAAVDLAGAGAGEVKAIIVSHKGGLTAYRAKVYLDCTGDADLAVWAGAQFNKGNARGEKLMPATHCFVLSNVDEQAYKTGPELHGGNRKSPVYDIIKSGKYPLIPDSHCCQNLIGPGTVGFNAGHLWNVDNTDPVSVSKAVMQGRQMAAQYRDSLAEYHPAFRNAFLASTGSLIGIRETRRIVGDYELTLEDFLARRTFEDEICRNAYFIDVHWAKEEATTDPSLMGKWEEKTYHYGPGESHGIPYRCLTPKGVSNVLVAGRSISCQQIVQGSVRVMPVCLVMGEAAGIAAAMAMQIRGNDVHQVDVQGLRTKLRGYGAYLP
jgi:FAD dependent oxidoreductase